MTDGEYAVRAHALRIKLYKTALLYLGNETAALDALDEAVYRGSGDTKSSGSRNTLTHGSPGSSSTSVTTSCAAGRGYSPWRPCRRQRRRPLTPCR